jgi:putative ABC transport system permease protein
MLAVRTEGDPLGALAPVSREIHSLDPELPVADVKTLERVAHDSFGDARFLLFLTSIFATLALILATVGLYGVMSYSVTQRYHEIGVRMALGAECSHVIKLVLGQGLVVTFAGILIGVSGAFALSGLLSSFLFGVSPTDPLTLLAENNGLSPEG